MKCHELDKKNFFEKKIKQTAATTAKVCTKPEKSCYEQLLQQSEAFSPFKIEKKNNIVTIQKNV